MFRLLVLILVLTVSSLVEGQQNGELVSMGQPGRLYHPDSPAYQNKQLNREREGQPQEQQQQQQPHNTKVQFLDSNGQPVLVQFTYVGPPKILPIATADSYPEGSTINLICTVSGGQRRGLVLSWQLDGEEIDQASLRHSKELDNVAINMDDSDITRLKITNATLKNSGQYTCNAKNPLGEDSTSVRIVINGE